MMKSFLCGTFDAKSEGQHRLYGSFPSWSGQLDFHCCFGKDQAFSCGDFFSAL